MFFTCFLPISTVDHSGATPSSAASSDDPQTAETVVFCSSVACWHISDICKIDGVSVTVARALHLSLVESGALRRFVSLSQCRVSDAGKRFLVLCCFIKLTREVCTLQNPIFSRLTHAQLLLSGLSSGVARFEHSGRCCHGFASQRCGRYPRPSSAFCNADPAKLSPPSKAQRPTVLTSSSRSRRRLVFTRAACA